ncbi:MAG TPA: hypothetical protein VFW98_06550 [Gemmatimonadaceae bacterium]|nr:hypothetical protein [Gemmatimonadaceae bacterium]
MEPHDDTEQHEEARGEEPCEGEYPRGRGYGQDYMRGGEVFGGYGYSNRPDYGRPLAEQPAPAADNEEEAEGADAGSVLPPDANQPRDGAGAESTDGAPPVPQIERSYGSEGNRNYSRSYYLTQAQLQRRLYEPPETEQDQASG